MKSFKSTLAALVAVLLLNTFCPVLVRAQADGSHLAVVNLRLVYSNMQESIDTEQAVKTLQDQLTKLSSGDQAELQEQTKKITGAAKSPAVANRDGLTADLDKMAEQFQVQEQTLKLAIRRKQNLQLKHAFDQIQIVVADLARKRGFDAVLVNSGINLPSNAGEIIDTDKLANAVFNRSVLHITDEMDITAEVIGLLNKTYKSPNPSAAPSALPSTSMKIGSKTYTLEIAGDDASRELGLMERDTLGADHGMIFIFSDAVEQSFWMHHTRFPLDIIYADDHARIISVKTMKAYDESAVPSDGPAKYAIELSAGQAAAAGVKAGDLLQIPAGVNAALKD